MNRKRTPNRMWLALGLVPAGLAVWVCVRHSAADSRAAGQSAPLLGGSGATSGGSEPAEARLPSVHETVARRNHEAHRDEEAFTRAGWKMVVADPPDKRLVKLDPALLDGREREVRVQIASTMATPEMAPNLARIAARAHDPMTRVDAVEALGRVGASPEAQKELLGLVDTLPADDEARRAVVPLLRPRALDDEETPKLAALLDSPSLSPQEKQQLAFTLALVGLRDGMKVPDNVGLSADARKLIDSMTLLAQRGSAVAQGGNP